MEAVWIALGGNAAFLLVVAFLGRRLLAQWLEKDLARFKDRLAADSTQALERTRAELQLAGGMELERLKGELAVVAAEREILLSRLQDRRAEVIGALYAKIAIEIRLTSSFVSPVQWAWEPKQKEKANTARDALIEAEERFDESQIWLSDSCAKSVNALMAELRSAYNNLAVWMPYMDKPGEDSDARQARDAWTKSWDLVKTKVVVARQALEAEMRSLLVPVPIRRSESDAASTDVTTHLSSGA